MIREEGKLHNWALATACNSEIQKVFTDEDLSWASLPS